MIDERDRPTDPAPLAAENAWTAPECGNCGPWIGAAFLLGLFIGAVMT